MGDIRSIVTLSIVAALGSAVVFNAGKVTPLLSEVRKTWLGIIESVSGVNRGV